MFGGMNPKQMQQMMRQMGIKNTEIPSKKVTIEKEDGTTMVITEPSVVMIEMQGQKTFQVSGNVSEGESNEEEKEDDVSIVMKSANCTKEQAEEALRESNGGIAEAIMRLENK